MAKRRRRSGQQIRGLTLRHTLRGHSGHVRRAAWSPCGRFVASPSDDGTVRIWVAATGDVESVLEGHPGGAVAVAWSPDGTTLASSSQETPSQVRFWKATSWQESPVSVTTGDFVADALAWSPDGEILAARAYREELCLLRPESLSTAVYSKSPGGWASFGLAWSPDGKSLALGSFCQIYIVAVAGDSCAWRTLEGPSRTAMHLAWAPDGRSIAVAGYGSRIVVFEVDEPRTTLVEGHTAETVDSIALHPSGRLAISSTRAELAFWRTNPWSLIGTIKRRPGATAPEGFADHLAFDPAGGALLSTHHEVGDQQFTIRIWDVDLDAVLGAPVTHAVRYSSAKVVLLGESNIGKSCLAMRLAEDRYPTDELGTTHGMRIWTVGAQELEPATPLPTGHRRDVVLWDFGGQAEYQLVHQLFLHDTTVALILIDPTRGAGALDQAREWMRRLAKHIAGRPTVRLLVGAKQDETSALVDRAAIEELCRECGFDSYHEVSAKTGRNIAGLRAAVAAALDWSKLSQTSRPELFQSIRDDVERRRARGDIVVLLTDLQASTRNADDAPVVKVVADQLATQGVVAQTRLTGGEEVLVLQLPAIERYAGSLIVAARNNPSGVPALEERLLGLPSLPLPGLRADERLPRLQERIVLECIAELMIQHGLCFRHEALLVFPSLFPEAGVFDAGAIAQSVSIYYDFTGAIDNIYASLVAGLMVSREFGEGRLWPNRAEFDRQHEGICGIHQVKRQGGLARVDLFFAEETDVRRRDLFTRFVEDHLRLHGVEIREHEAITCRVCGRTMAEDIVRVNIEAGQSDVICPWCRTVTLISEGVGRIRERDALSDHKVYALRQRLKQRTDADAQRAKQAVATHAASDAAVPDVIRILHLSDLHFSGATSPSTKVQWLLQDLRRGAGLGIKTVEYLVISGDMTDRGKEDGFEKAREFVSLLNDELGISAERSIFVPGNHDVVDLDDAFDWYSSEARAAKAEPDRKAWHREGSVIFVRNPKNYPNRLKKFSDMFFHKLVQRPYPLASGEQGLAYLFPATGVQFLTFSSCWQIDQFNRRRAGVSPEAVAGSIAQADKQISDAIARGELSQQQLLLRIGVWHHSMRYAQGVQGSEFLATLQQAGVRLCLHGDVHENNRELFGWHSDAIHIAGAGSFGAAAEGRPESIPRLYNLLEVRRDLSSVRIHTRRQMTADGAWGGWNEWPRPDRGPGGLPYYDIAVQ